MNPSDFEGLGKVLYFLLYYSAIVTFYTFKAAIEHGGATAGAIVLVVILGAAVSGMIRH